MGRTPIAILSITLSTVINYFINKHVMTENIVIQLRFINIIIIVLSFVCLFIGMLVKANLPDDLDYKSYKYWALKEYIKNENDRYKVFLAKLYIQNDKFVTFVAGWFIGYVCAKYL